MSVSYLITLYNKEEFIAGVLDAVLHEQMETGGEIIIYDDVSTDRSPQIVNERIKEHPAQAGAVRVIRGEKNRGVGFATNYLIDAATQPYTRLVDADDVLIRGSTAHMLRHMQANNLDFIYGTTTEVGNEPPWLDHQPFDNCTPLENPVREILRHTVAGASPSLFVSAVLKKAAPVPEWIRRTQDFLLTLRVANGGARIGGIKDIVSIGPSNRTVNNMSASLAAMFGEMSRDVAHDGLALPLDDLRYACGRYAARAAKYFRRRGRSRLTSTEKAALWRWRHFSLLASRQACIARLNRVADFFERDREVLVTGPSGPQTASRRRLPRRWAMFRLTDALAARMPAPRQKKGVLILRMFGIGDALLFRAVLEKYAEALNVPLSDITILGATGWQAVADLFFRDVKTILIDERRFGRNFAYRLRVMLDLRRRGFKTAVCSMRLRYPYVTESLMLAGGAEEMIVAQPHPNEKFDAMFAHYVPRMTRVIALPEAGKPRDANGAPLPLMHEIAHQLAFLSALAGRKIQLPGLPRLPVLSGPAPLVRESERYAVLNIGASYGPKRWPLANFFDIARRLAGQGHAVVFLGGPAEMDLKDEIAAFIIAQKQSGARFIQSVNELDFAAAARLIAGAALVVSSDSGFGHLAVLLGRPATLIVGGGHFGYFMPYPAALTPPGVRFLHHPMPCYHCNWGCTMMPPGGATFPCMDGVTVEQVWQAIGSMDKAA